MVASQKRGTRLVQAGDLEDNVPNHLLKRPQTTPAV
jgi:hypothetical protein